MEKVTCEYCGNQYSKFGIKNHIESAHAGNKKTFKKPVWNKGKKLDYSPSNKIPLFEILNGDHPHYQTKNLKPRLIADGLKQNRCESCGISEWNGSALNLELHHVNGDGTDHRLENLQILCPNCHSQTSNYKNKNKGNGKRVRAQPSIG